MERLQQKFNSRRDSFEKMLVVLALITLVTSGCSSDSGNGNPVSPQSAAGIVPSPGAWSGKNISFTVNPDSASLSNFSVTYSGHADGSRCSFDYNTTLSLSSSVSIADGKFTLTLATETINGTFSGPNTASVELSWSKFNSQCNATASGSRRYTATL